MNNFDKKVVQLILKAQQNSSAAKEALDYDESKRLYGIKDKCLSEAFHILKGERNSRIQYMVQARPDQNGHASLVIYFEFNYKGKHYQFSFHNFNFKVFGLKPNDAKTIGNKAIVWNGVIGGCNKNYQEIIKHS